MAYMETRRVHVEWHVRSDGRRTGQRTIRRWQLTAWHDNYQGNPKLVGLSARGRKLYGGWSRPKAPCDVPCYPPVRNTITSANSSPAAARDIDPADRHAHVNVSVRCTESVVQRRHTGWGHRSHGTFAKTQTTKSTSAPRSIIYSPSGFHNCLSNRVFV